MNEQQKILLSVAGVLLLNATFSGGSEELLERVSRISAVVTPQLNQDQILEVIEKMTETTCGFYPSDA